MYHCWLYFEIFFLLDVCICILRYSTHQLQPHRTSHFVLKGWHWGLRGAWGWETDIIHRAWLVWAMCWKNSPPWSQDYWNLVKSVLNRKGSRSADAVLMCVFMIVCLCVPVCAQVTDKLERCGWWHLHEWVNLLLTPPHTTTSIVLLGSGGLTAGALLSQTHTREHKYRHMPRWGGRESWKWGCASCDGEH